MKKRLSFIGIILLFAALLLPLGGVAEENLLQNGSFEALDEQGVPTGWYTDAYFQQPGYTEYGVATGAKDGQNGAFVKNIGANDARFAQIVSVEPDALYCLSGYIRTEDVPDSGLGANLSIADVYIFSLGVYGTQNEWQYITLYGRTGPDQTSVTVFARLGGYGGESVGKAYFDDIRLTKVTGVPQGELITTWYKQEAVDNAASEETNEGAPFWPWLIVLSLVYLGFAAYLLPKLQKENGKSPLIKEEGKRTETALFLALLTAFFVRIWLSVTVPGYEVDINCFLGWGNTMLQSGPAQFYTSGGFADYPPVYLYVLWLNALVSRWISPASQATNLLIVKFVPILADMAAAWLLYRLGKNWLPKISAAAMAVLYAFNPVVILNGSAWGQVDSVLALGLLLVAVLALERKWEILLPAYVLCALIKPQALMLGPLGLAALLFDVFHPGQKKPWKALGFGLLWSVVVAVAVLLPFTIGQKVTWIVDLYKQTLSSYPYATLNTANLYYLLNANWVSVDTQISRFVPYGLGLLLAFLSAWQGMHIAKQGGSLLQKYSGPAFALAAALAYLILGTRDTSYALFGAVTMALVILWVVLAYIRGGRLENLPLMGAILFIGLYVLGIKMHERYMFPALLLLALAYLQKRDGSIFLLLIGFSITTFVNTGIVLDNSIRLGSSMGHLNQDTQFLNMVLSVTNLVLAGFAFFTGERLCAGNAPGRSIAVAHVQTQEAKTRESRARETLLHPKDAALHLSTKDWVIMASVTALYAVLAFWNLGSTKAPQTAWVSTQPGEQVVLDLGKSQAFEMLYFGGINYNDFSVAVSEDGLTWPEEYPAQMKEGNCFQWQYVAETNAYGESISYTKTPRLLTGRYVRVTAKEIGLTLHEVILRNTEGKVLPATLSANIGNNPDSTLNKPASNLIDEQDTLEGEPGWFTGTYFDEIYHARTAYEHANGINPYENSHPPLGKVMMSWAVMIFGMTPFGWRFAGALTGVLMLPAMFLLGKQLTRRTDLAAAAMLLMTFDLMHFTQTRIATIDSFPVLFIMLSALCMFRYLMMDFWGTPLYKMLIPLALSGLFMGLGIASKWVGIYAGAGLGVLFFWSCSRHLREGLEANKLKAHMKSVPEDRRKAVELAAGKSLQRVLMTCLWCLLFFVAVPALIYYLSYIPYFAPSGGVTVQRIIDAQKHMFAYHSTPGLGADHPYQSPWWEWPLILKPMWYYTIATIPPEGMSSTIFCMGNPAVWWAGFAALLTMFFVWGKRHVWQDSEGRWLHADTKVNDVVPSLLLIGFLSQYLPWVLVPRSTFIYHYFASVPFIILCTVVCFGWLKDAGKKWAATCMWGLVALAALLFIGFYPYASGMTVSTEWLDFMKWFPRIYY